MIFLERLIKKRTERIVNTFDAFIQKGDTVLDIGAGSGWIGKEIRKRKAAFVTLLDVVNFNRTDLKFVLYDGESMPFEDKSFDTVLLLYVLHHAENPEHVLQEAKRISKKKIIILEDSYTSWFGKIGLCVWDVVTNIPSFLVKPFGEKMPFHFKKVSQWKKLFEDFNLRILFQAHIAQNPLVKHVLFVLCS